MDFKIGEWVMNIKAPEWGKGKIIEITRTWVKIKFEYSGEKRLSPEYSNLIKAEPERIKEKPFKSISTRRSKPSSMLKSGEKLWLNDLSLDKTEDGVIQESNKTRTVHRELSTLEWSFIQDESRHEAAFFSILFAKLRNLDFLELIFHPQSFDIILQGPNITSEKGIKIFEVFKSNLVHGDKKGVWGSTSFRLSDDPLEHLLKENDSLNFQNHEKKEYANPKEWLKEYIREKDQINILMDFLHTVGVKSGRKHIEVGKLVSGKEEKKLSKYAENILEVLRSLSSGKVKESS